MRKEFWHQRWQFNQIEFNQVKPNPLLLQYFVSLNLKPGNRVFVPLCGKSIDMLWFASQGYDVVGVELSSIACDAFFKEHLIPVEVFQSDTFTVYQSEKITLLSGDFFDLNKERLGNVDAIYDRAALIALPAELRKRYATFLMKLVDTGTPMLLIAGKYNQNEMEGPPFSVDENEVKALYGDRFNIQQLYNQPVESIPSHLQARGLSASSSEVYYLSSNTKI